MAPKLARITPVVLTAFLLITSSAADVRQGNVREKGTCAVPPSDCLYTQSGWHKTHGTWYVSDQGQWSDGTYSEYCAYPFGVSFDSVVREVYVGGGFAYFGGYDVPESMTIDVLVADADASLRPVSGCCLPAGETDLIARYTIDVADVWPAVYSDVYGCGFGDYEKMRVPMDPPLDLDAQCNYYVCCYANGDETVRLWATIDMLCGPDRFTKSFDAGQSFEGWWWFGGQVASGLDFELRGDILDASCLCDVCAEEGWEVLYDQVSKHSFTNGSIHAAPSYGAGETTRIFGQAFNYQRDGYLKCIGLGGTFGQFGDPPHEIPDNLIVEMWCMSGQEGDLCEPITLLRRWIVPVEELIETEDPEGYPLLNFFTEDYPGPYTWCDTTAPGGSVWATDDRPFLFVAYSDGDERAPFEWFTDMCKGYCRFSGTMDCEQSWIHIYYWGPPEEGNPEANFSFVLCGGCEETCAPADGDEVVDSGYLAGPLFGQPRGGYPGWVWFSIPLDPADCCDGENCYDPNTLLGFDAGGKLFMWDKYGKFQRVYRLVDPWEFEVGGSYLFYMDGSVANPCYTGINPYVSSRLAGGEPRFFAYHYGVQLGKMGWTWVGLPGDVPIYGGGLATDFGEKVRVMYPADLGAVRTAAEDVQAIPDNWLDWGWSYYDTYLQAPKTFKFSAPFGNKHCFPWIGYRVWVRVGTAEGPYDAPSGDNANQAVLVWPAPECFYDPDYP